MGANEEKLLVHLFKCGFMKKCVGHRRLSIEGVRTNIGTVLPTCHSYRSRLIPNVFATDGKYCKFFLQHQLARTRWVRSTLSSHCPVFLLPPPMINLNNLEVNFWNTVSQTHGCWLRSKNANSELYSTPKYCKLMSSLQVQIQAGSTA